MNDARRIDADYRAATGLTSRDDYKIFYSRLAPSRIMTIGINPGGRSDDWFEASRSGFYDEGEHDFIECRDDPRYDLACPMFQVLAAAAGTMDLQTLRAIPHTNMSFRRSVDATGCLPAHVRETRPYLAGILDTVQPDLVIFAGRACDLALDSKYGFLSDMRNYREAIPIANGKALIPFYKEFDATLHAGGKSKQIKVIALAHPSRYAKRKTPWAQALAIVQSSSASALT
jgi:hypothetical protein